ncbi:MAG: hypothetical protein HFE45_04335 [Oscillospiraceae bacterium]|jgi:hypothetical protein|nr:hypothetical protein [Oscillospiraceae bacterium]
MIELKGIHESYPVHAASSASSALKRARGEELAAGAVSGIDSVRISPEGAFRAKLNTALASCVREASSVPKGRMEQLKASYQGDQCPIPAQDTAAALLSRVCGAGRIEGAFMMDGKEG